ncbi:hypothetical protein FRC07_003745 [Ceratobasidium sp. 392]|nr:hypothetical protein FRC07_003745 [Ceratobasidium sp. 392]
MSPDNSIDAAPKPFQGIWEGRNKILGYSYSRYGKSSIGTTQSRVSFAFLKEGENQIIHNVTQWPGQKSSSTPSKIPSVVWYDLNGKAVAFGAEATSHQAEADAQKNGWQLARYFKLHLHPKDFLFYLLKHTRSCFEARMLDGKKTWESYQSEMEVVSGRRMATHAEGRPLLYPSDLYGAEQKIHRVTQWPGQESQNQNGKIPTIVWYDTDKKAVSFGAEALTPQAELDAEDYGWQLAKHFKLHLHPADLAIKHGLDLEPLPAGVSLSQIYTDFLQYLLQQTQTYFEDHILDGKRTWKTYSPTLEVVIAHPNGWGIREQTFLRSAAVAAGFVNASDAGSRVHFVSEAEASVHFCIFHTNLGSQLNPGVVFAVCDAGGSTVDTTVYSVKSTNPLLLEETRASACVQAGAIFIDAAAKKYLQEVLRNAGLSPEEVEEYVSRGVKDFEGNAKRAFRDTIMDQCIEISGTRFNNPAIRTRRGRMNVPGSTIASLFEFCLTQIMRSVESQLESTIASYILLVGGFGESLYLREQLKARFEPHGCQITTTSDATFGELLSALVTDKRWVRSKAVSDGALIWFCSSSVVKRAPWFSYGIEILVPYDPKIQAHRRRKTAIWPSGQFAKGGWSQIVDKVCLSGLA